MVKSTKMFKNIFIYASQFVLICYATLYVGFHVVLFVYPQTVIYLTFQNYLNYPFGNLSNPTEFGLENVYNFHLNTDANIKIGVWHFIPKERHIFNQSDLNDSLDQHFVKYVNSDEPIVIFAHGNAGNRASHSNKMKAVKLCELNYSVFALDYRGYGDSTGWPSEQGVVHDLISLYTFIKSYNKTARVYIYGHSLGTGIAAHASKILSDRQDPPSGVILEAPFLNVSHSATEYMIAKYLYNNPWIIGVANKALEDLNLNFNNDKHISKINSKILIFHSESDKVIPHHRSLDLIRIAQFERLSHLPSVELHIIDKSHGIGHSTLHTHDDAYPIIKDFFQ